MTKGNDKMIIERKSKIEPVFLSTLDYGDCFEYNEEIFMVIGLYMIDGRCPNCNSLVSSNDLFKLKDSIIVVELSDDYGCVYSFNNIKVTPIKLKAVEV